MASIVEFLQQQLNEQIEDKKRELAEKERRNEEEANKQGAIIGTHTISHALSPHTALLLTLMI